MAMEVQAVGIDISFAPVLDINARSDVIGDRAFADNAQDVTRLAAEFIAGMHEVGMAATGKHFPGHGSVQADSYISPSRLMNGIKPPFATDIPLFRVLAKKLQGVMPAHVIYPELDDKPAVFPAIGYSRYCAPNWALTA